MLVEKNECRKFEKATRLLEKLWWKGKNPELFNSFMIKVGGRNGMDRIPRRRWRTDCRPISHASPRSGMLKLSKRRILVSIQPFAHTGRNSPIPTTYHPSPPRTQNQHSKNSSKDQLPTSMASSELQT